MIRTLELRRDAVKLSEFALVVSERRTHVLRNRMSHTRKYHKRLGNELIELYHSNQESTHPSLTLLR